uniref:ABC transporter permease n=1 Tax=Roseihalotalea indica TaxID=2867963 RepID=A0AA49JCJ0_9BACT|nr:ABC transporter permease [Tunicatimonas sp. TK19036]
MIKRLAHRFFQWYCHPDYYDEIVGDLEEIYQRNVANGGQGAQWKYLLQVLGLFRPGLIRSFSHYPLINLPMFRNYFKISLRNLLRYKLFATINILGLAVGLAAFLLINEYIRFEESYDGFFTDAGQIYRLSTVQVVNDEIGVKDAMTYHPAAKVLHDELPEVEETTVTYKFGELIFRQDDRLISEKQVIAADANFFSVFDYQVLQGSPNDMLAEPNTLVLTQSKAESYFGDQDPVGQTLEILGRFNQSFKVTGVIQDIPENTHYKFDMLISDESIKEQYENDDWNGFNYYSYIKLKPQASIAEVEDKLVGLSKKYLGEGGMRFNIFPVTDIHLQSDYTFEAEIPGSEKAVAFTRIIALFILFIAWINYVNLSTARAVNRAKEVGLRKVVGAYKIQLIGQFLFEALLVNFLASLIALLISELSLPYFRQLVGQDFLPHVWNQPPFLYSLLIFFVVGSIASGFYPALVLSGFKPVAVLKGKYRNTKSGALLRKGLVVVQFTASVVLIAGTFIVYQQLRYMQGKDLGISTDYVVGVNMPRGQNNEESRERITTQIQSFKDALRQHSAIETVGGTSNLPGGDGSDINSNAGKLRIVGLTDRQTGTTYLQFNDEDFLDAVNMQLLYGRNFDRNRVADSLVVMVNQAFLRKFNISDDGSVLNEYIQFGEDDMNRKFEIIGVVKDFNRTSLKSSVEPTLYFPDYAPDASVVKLNPEQYQEGLAYMQETWAEFFPDTPLNYTFLDDRFAALYEQDRRFGEIFGTLSVLAILIAILGLFGLSSFMAVQRTTEVGVRKVLGASVPNIIGIFYKDFLVLLGIAGLIGIPATYFGMNTWLENYAYRIDFPWLIAVLAIGIVMVFALMTVGYQVYQVAILDPAKTLKEE